MADIIDGESGSWKEADIAMIFNLQEAEATIYSLPISNMDGKDMVIWRFTKTGKYSIKSGYHLELKEADA